LASLYDLTIQQVWYFFKKYLEIFSRTLERNGEEFTQCIQNKGVIDQEYLTTIVVNCGLVLGIKGTLFQSGITFGA
jgi:hypothetical protein